MGEGHKNIQINQIVILKKQNILVTLIKLEEVQTMETKMILMFYH